MISPGTFSARQSQGAPRTCRCIETRAPSGGSSRRGRVREHHALVSALRRVHLYAAPTSPIPWPCRGMAAVELTNEGRDVGCAAGTGEHPGGSRSGTRTPSRTSPAARSRGRREGSSRGGRAAASGKGAKDAARFARTHPDPRDRRVTREDVPLADVLAGYPAISRTRLRSGRGGRPRAGPATSPGPRWTGPAWCDGA